MAIGTGDVAGGDAVRPRRAGIRLTQAQLTLFLDTLAATGNVRASARTVGVSIPTVYGRRQIDRAFAEGWETAKAIAYERLEEAVLSYAAARFAVDPDRAPAAADAEAVATRLAAPEVSRGDVDLALAMLTRLSRPSRGGRAVARPEESDALIRRKLDAYAKRLVAR